MRGRIHDPKRRNLTEVELSLAQSTHRHTLLAGQSKWGDGWRGPEEPHFDHE